MSIQSNVVFVMSIAAILFMCPRVGNAADKIDKAHEKNSNSRTWEVYNVQGAPGHITMGDKFRLTKKGSDLFFIPNGGLRAKWAKTDKDFSVTMKKNNGPAAGEKVLCGAVKVPGHLGQDHSEDHMIRVFPENDGEIKIEVLPRSAASIEEQCELEPIHGGMAHAEN